ncbi:class I SAM-dependent methyltransferase [bacterium]|nr:class I SAM-dependent methyltransferase [bacterium]
MNIRKYLAHSRFTHLVFEAFLLLRGLLFIGNQVYCPCCGWSFRTFIKSGLSLKKRARGYCPRCNAKARHRRNYLFLKEKTDLFQTEQTLLHVAPKYCLSRKFSSQANIKYVGVALENDFNISAVMDITSPSLQTDAVDSIVCIHVLEHLEQDRQAIRELYRVLKPGRWASISVPIRLDQPTYEDPNIVSPEDRKREFGEKDHVRIYGNDLINRLEEAGFLVELHLAEDINPHDFDKFGLMRDENIFLLTKPERNMDGNQ